MKKTKDSYEEIKEIIKTIDHCRLSEVKKAIAPNGRFSRPLQAYIIEKTGRTYSLNYIKNTMNIGKLEPAIIWHALLMAKEIEDKTTEQINSVRDYIQSKKAV